MERKASTAPPTPGLELLGRFCQQAASSPAVRELGRLDLDDHRVMRLDGRNTVSQALSVIPRHEQRIRIIRTTIARRSPRRSTRTVRRHAARVAVSSGSPASPQPPRAAPGVHLDGLEVSA